MKARNPRVSVGLPVYNGERYLQNALTRLLEQAFEDPIGLLEVDPGLDLLLVFRRLDLHRAHGNWNT